MHIILSTTLFLCIFLLLLFISCYCMLNVSIWVKKPYLLYLLYRTFFFFLWYDFLSIFLLLENMQLLLRHFYLLLLLQHLLKHLWVCSHFFTIFRIRHETISMPLLIDLVFQCLIIFLLLPFVKLLFLLVKEGLSWLRKFSIYNRSTIRPL